MTAPVLKSKRIKSRLFLWGIVISILPLLFLGFLSFKMVYSHMERMITETNFERASTIAKQTRDYVGDQIHSLFEIASTNSSVLIGKDPLARENVLGTLLREVPYVEEIDVIDSNFRILDMISRRELSESYPASYERMIEIPEDKSFTVSSISFTEYGRPQFYLSVRIQDPQNRKTLGYLQAKVDLKQIITEFVSVPIGKAGYIYFVDGQGNLFGHTDFSRILRQENVRENPLVKSFLEGQMSAKGVVFNNQDNTNVIGQFVAIETLNWGVFIEQPTQEAFQPIYSFAFTLLVIVLGTICIVTAVSIALGTKLVKPLENLESEVRRIISTGDLQAHIPIQTQDEVGSLVQSFNRLMNTVDEKNKSLEFEKQLLTTIVDGIGAGIVLLDRGKKMIWQNRMFTDWFKENSNGDYNDISQENKHLTLFMNGSKRYFRKKHYILSSDNNDSPVNLLLFEDVTQQIAMEAKMIETDKMVAVGLLASGVAHEINNPLAIISVYCEDLLEHAEEDNPESIVKEVKCVLNTILEQIFRCEDITNRLLNFARKPSEELDFFESGISTLNTLALLRYRAKQKKVTIRSNIEEELYVKGNENEWQQVVLNLITNALDASFEGGEIEVTAQSNAESISYIVKDNGCGIVKDSLTKVFDPFFTTKPAGQGTGLGLFVSYGIIHRMNGQLVIESIKGEGTTVKITLPSYPKGDNEG